MKRFLILWMLAIGVATSGIAFATDNGGDPAGLVKQLRKAQSGYELAEYSVYLAQRYESSSIDAKIAALGPARDSAHEKGKVAYQSFIVGKSPAQAAAAKKLYIAWLTMLDAFNGLKFDPGKIGEQPAGLAYNQAVNEYNVDYGD